MSIHRVDPVSLPCGRQEQDTDLVWADSRPSACSCARTSHRGGPGPRGPSTGSSPSCPPRSCRPRLERQGTVSGGTQPSRMSYRIHMGYEL